MFPAVVSHHALRLVNLHFHLKKQMLLLPLSHAVGHSAYAATAHASRRRI